MSNTLTATHELALADLERLPEVVDLVTECNRASAELLHRRLNIPLTMADLFINRLVADGVLVRDAADSRRVHVASAAAPVETGGEAGTAPVPNAAVGDTAGDGATAPDTSTGIADASATSGVERREVNLDDICVEPTIQPRVGLEHEVVNDYAAAYERGETLPPLELFDIDGYLTLVAGFHRLKAARQARLTTLCCEVRVGTSNEALLHAIASNAKHGVRMNSADKRKVIGLLLRDAEWVNRSNGAIGRFVGADHKTVAKVRKALEREGVLTDSQDGTRTVVRGGKTFTMNTKKISGANATPKPAPAAPPDGTDEIAEGTLDPRDAEAYMGTKPDAGPPRDIVRGAQQDRSPVRSPAGYSSSIDDEVHAAASIWIAALEDMVPGVQALAQKIEPGKRQNCLRSADHHLSNVLSSLRTVTQL